MTDLRELIRKAASSYCSDHMPGLIADDVLTNLEAAGLIIVPKEATEKMVSAGIKTRSTLYGSSSNIYSAMIEAATTDNTS